MLSLCWDVRLCAYTPSTYSDTPNLLHISLRHNLPYVVLNQLPPPSHITHIPQFNTTPVENSFSIPVDNESSNNATTDDQQSKDSHVTYSGAPLPPISTNLLKRIKEGTFIELAEILSEGLGHLSSDED